MTESNWTTECTSCTASLFPGDEMCPVCGEQITNRENEATPEASAGHDDSSSAELSVVDEAECSVLEHESDNDTEPSEPSSEQINEEPDLPDELPSELVSAGPTVVADDESACCLACGASIRAGMIRCRECGVIVKPASPDEATEPTLAEVEIPHEAVTEEEYETEEAVEAAEAEEAPAEEGLFCSMCGAEVRENMLRCRECGYFIVASTAPPEPAPTGENNDTSVADSLELEEAVLDGDLDDQADSLPPPPPIDGIEKRRKRRYRRLVVLVAAVGVLILLSATGVVSLPERRALEFQKALVSPDGPFNTVHFSGEEGRLVAGGTNGRIVVWENVNRAPVLLKHSTLRPILAIATAPGNLLAASDTEGKVFGWPLEGGEPSVISNFSDPVTTIVFRYTKTGQAEAIFGSTDGQLAILSTAGMKRLNSKHRGGVKRALYLKKPNLLITGGTNGNLIWRDAESRRVLLIIRGHKSEVSALASSADESMVASADWNGKILVWNVQKKKQAAKFQQKTGISGLAFHSRYLISADWNGMLWFIPLVGGLEMHGINTGSAIYGLAISPDGKTIATVSQRKQIDLWDMPVSVSGHASSN